MTMQTKGFGAARVPPKDKPIDRYCISPQLAPPYLDKRNQTAMRESENYHASKGSDRK